MEMIYVLVFFSLALSLGFLALFFWAVDSDQFNSMSSVPWSILEDETTETSEELP
ncbi:MAG: cbb3-type cytochrome oxidase assembly protein CcoS [Bdellovibrionales bacterium]|nr:cbb3-type cytochrome oxidase assembly protein CcoS [Bdellovibrionales bacterium]